MEIGSKWTWDPNIQANAFGCFIPSAVLSSAEGYKRVWVEFFNGHERWPDFHPDELRCKGNGDLRIHYATLDALQGLRNDLKRPIKVNSYYRSPDYNSKVGGAPASKHMAGMAVDTPTFATEIGRLTLWHYASRRGFRGIGLYNTFTHLDFGPHRVWDERTMRTIGKD